MSIIDNILSVVVPHDCLVCGHEGKILCTVCIDNLPKISPACFGCQNPSYDYATCSDCRVETPLSKVMVVAEYTGPAKTLLWKLKTDGIQEAARIMALEIAKLLPGSLAGWILVAVPTSNRRRRQRGYDQARLIAKELQRITGLHHFDVLRRRGEIHQVGASIEARKTQLQNTFEIINKRSIKDRSIILVDDVVTTGATLEAAAITLKAAGAKQVQAVCFAHPKLRNDSIKNSH